MKLDELRARLGPKTALIVRGIPGAGKTRLTQSLADKKLRAVAFDDFRLRNGHYKYDPRQNEDVRSAALRRFRTQLRMHNGPVSIEGVFSSPERIEEFRDVARRHGREPVVVTVKADVDAAAKRGVHGVSRESTERMAKSLAESKLPADWAHVELDGDD